MGTELFRNEYVQASIEGDLIALHWDREEPDDAHALSTEKAVTGAVDEWLTVHPGQRIAVLVDLLVVKHTFPRATAAYAGWLLGQRSRVIGGAFVTKSLLLRASIGAVLLIPGLTVKGFSDLEEARRFLSKLAR